MLGIKGLLKLNEVSLALKIFHKLFIWLLPVIGTCIVIVYIMMKFYDVKLRQLKDKYKNIVEKRKNTHMGKGFRIFLVLATILFFTEWLVFYSLPREIISHIFSLSYVPRNGWIVAMFNNEPWFFYLQRMVELYPIHIFAYLSLFFLPYNQHHRGFHLILVYLGWVLSFFILWRGFESRYVLPAIPVLIILAAFSMVKLYDTIKTVKYPVLAKVLSGLFFSTIVFFIIKGMQINFVLSLPSKSAHW